MDITVIYGGDKMELTFPDNVNFDEYKPNMVDDSAIGIDRFAELIDSSEKDIFPLETADLVIVNDPYRPTPTATILDWLTKLNKLSDRVEFIVATGTHEIPSADRLRNIFGELYDSIANRIFVHAADDKNTLIEIGVDSFNQPVSINEHLYRARRVIVIGSVEPHYFAGFTGGRKSFFPGLCDYDTTVRNHNLAVSLDCAPMKTEGNPVHEHLESLMILLKEKEIFSIQTVPGAGRNKAEVSLFCGSVAESFNNAKQLSERIFGHKVDRRYDLLIGEVHHPLDRNLYQLQKSLENCHRVVKDEGELLLLSACRDGIGSDKFYNLIDRWDPATDKLPKGREAFGIHKLLRVYQISKRIGINLYSALENGKSDKVFYKSIKNPQSFIDSVMEGKNNVNVALVHDAGHVAFNN